MSLIFSFSVEGFSFLLLVLLVLRFFLLSPLAFDYPSSILLLGANDGGLLYLIYICNSDDY